MEQTIGLIVLVAAILVLAVLLPFTASFLLDTTAAARRGKGLLPPVLVFVASGVILYLGLLVWSAGMRLSAGSPVLAEWAPEAMMRGLVLMLAFSIPLSVLTGGLRVWRETAGPLDSEAARRREARRVRRSLRRLDGPGVAKTVDGARRQESDELVTAQSAA